MNNFIRRSQCPACSGTNSAEIYSCDLLKQPVRKFIERKFNKDIFGHIDGAKYVLLECLDCSLVYQGDVLNNQLMNQLYEEWLNYHDAEIETCDDKTPNLERSLRYAQEILKLIVYMKMNPNSIDVLDYGMGWGNWLNMAKALGCNTYGTDLSTTRVEHVRAQGITVVDINELGNYKFDYINTEQVLEHVPYPLDTLKMLKLSLKDKGIIKISVPDGADIKDRLKIMDWEAPRTSRKFLMPATPLIHINSFSPKSIRAMAAKAGLKPIDIPLRCEYASIYNLGVKNLMKNIVRPIYRKLKETTYLFFQNSSV